MAKDDWKQSASTRGKAAELRFMQLALEHGWDVACPVVEDSPYDVLIHRGSDWERVQVKRAYLKRGHLTVNLVRYDKKRYASNDAAWLAAVEVETGRCWLIPFGEVAQYQRKRLTADLDQYLLDGPPCAEDDDGTEAPF